MKRSHRLTLLTSTMIATLIACGGGGGSSSDTSNLPGGNVQAQAVTMQTYITDNLATEYSQVWVTIKKITAHDAGGKEVTLFDAMASPLVVNLSSLASVGQLMSTVAVPAGIYTEIHVTLENRLQLVSLDGATTTVAKFDKADADFVWKVREVSVDASAPGQIVLDFNLAKFTINAATGLVVPNLELPRPHDAFNKFVRQQAEVHASVQSVDVATGVLTVNDPRLGQGVVVRLSKDAVLLNEVDGKVLTLADLVMGQRLEIKGVVTPGVTTSDPVTVLASVIRVESAQPSGLPKPARVHGEGQVTAVHGSLATVAIKEANFLPGTHEIVVDLASAQFAHGVATDVVAGITLEFGGTLNGTGASTQVMALLANIEGALSAREREKKPGEHFLALGGTITKVNDNGTFDMSANHAEGPMAMPGTYTINPTGTLFAKGKAACLVVGAQVKVAGSLGNDAVAAKAIAVPGCNGQMRSESFENADV